MTRSSFVCSLVAALAVIVLALQAHRRDRDTSTFVLGCDTFGYERMARVVRDGRATRSASDYFVHDEQTRWLIGKFKENGVPVPAWAETVATHSHHYFPGSDQVAPQYPPGTGWVLSLFPPPNDVKALDRLTILLVTVVGLGLAGWCAWRGLVASSLVLAGSVAAVLWPFSWIEARSYSINATILPLFAGTLLAWAATRVRLRALAWVLALAAGGLFGLLIQVRLASALLVPAVALLFVPRRWWLLFGYGTGTVLTGIIPVLMHNRTITGSLFGATYGGGDRQQSLGSLADNFHFYFGRHFLETGCLHILGLLAILGLWLTITTATGPRGAVPAWRAWLASHYGLVAAPFCAAGLSTAYFLTHVVAIDYYLVPAMVLTGLLLGLLFVALEERWQKSVGDFLVADTLRRSLAAAVVVVTLPLAAFNYHGLEHLLRATLEMREDSPYELVVPAALLDPHAWIWADVYSSSIIYYTGHPAFKVSFATPETRLLMYGWVHDKGDPQYLLTDTDNTKSFVGEARAHGWQLTPVGEVLNEVCYRIDRP